MVLSCLKLEVINNTPHNQALRGIGVKSAHDPIKFQDES